MQPIIHPYFQKLHGRIQELHIQIECVVQEWYTLAHQERAVLNNVYAQEFGELEQKLQYLAVEDAEIFRRVELLSIKVSRGEILTEDIIRLINAVVDKEYARYHQRLHDAFVLDAEQREMLAKNATDRPDSAEVVDMYRTLVKTLHPDVTGKQETPKVWEAVQNAYREKNATQLRSLLRVIGVKKELFEQPASSIEELEREIETLETKLRVEQRKLQRLQNQEPFSIRESLYDEAWKLKHKKKLEEEIDQRKRSIIENQRLYCELTAQTVAPRTLSEQLADQQNADQEFMENTYFKGR